MHAEYTGWIPNVSGCLSFSHIGGLTVRNRIISEDVFPPTKFLEDAPYLSLLQRRNLSDRPAIGLAHANPEKGRLTFLLIAELRGDQQSTPTSMAGVIVFAPTKLGRPLEDLHEQLKSEQLHSLQDVADGPLKGLSNQLGEAFCAIHFDLFVDGVVALRPISRLLPDDDMGPIIAFEAYSFLKDVLHKHRFHSGTDDATLELTPCGIKDPLWAERVVRNLHRSVIASFRTARPASQVDGLGKLSYLESFLGVIDKRRLTVSRGYALTPLRSALEAHQARAALERDEKNLAWSYILSMAAIVVPVIFVTLQLLQIPCIRGLTWTDQCAYKLDVSPNIIDLANVVLTHLEWVLLGTTLVTGIVLLALNRRRLFAYNSEKLSLATWTNDLRDLFFRIAISSTRSALVLLFVLAAVIIALYAGMVWWLLEM